MMSQCEQILAQYNCFRLRERINHLREKGYKIATDEIRRGGKCFASYRLVLGQE